VNYHLFETINNLSGNPTLDAVMKAAARDAIFASFAVLAVLCLWRLRDRRVGPVVATGAGLVLTFLLGLAAAAIHPEKRPFQTHHVHQLVAHAGGQAFPSDHATAAFGIALAVAAFLSWRWGIPLLVIALLIGFARVYDGIHYPGDIAGGLLAAVIGVGVVVAVERYRGSRRSGYGRPQRASSVALRL
jgi:undecaprenyl-diphosphatase